MSMTKEQEDSIEMLENTDISTIELAENVDLYTYNIAVKNVLNMLKEQENKIERLESTLVENHAREINNSIYESNKSKEDLEMLNRGWQIECEKKDKIIDLMARAIDNYDSQLAINTFRDKEYVKEYFAGLVKKE